MDNQEIEAKFYIRDMAGLEQRLLACGGRLVQPRTFENNLRFDTPDRALGNRYQVLRLRLDTAARLTFKGPGVLQDGVKIRQEIEFTVGDFDAAHALLEALGFRLIMAYEKYRTTYDLGGVHVLLDELPYGPFAEIEGPDLATIQATGRSLGLAFDAAVEQSYTMLFEQLKISLGLSFRDLTFENFAKLQISAQDLDVIAADGGV